MEIPYSPEQTRSTLQALPDGVAGTRETLRLMVEMARKGKRTLAVRRLAQQILVDVPQKAWIAEVRSIQAYVRDHVRYTMDIRDIETLQTPEKTIEFNQGDCDDKSILVASLLESVNHPARFIAVGQEPNAYEHVYVETRIANHWIPVETTEPVGLGWQPDPNRYRYRLVYNV
ncbi:MAG TPA: transglutaminase-like domain-containing protein [Candidatus Paceibacterota bacterium]